MSMSQVQDTYDTTSVAPMTIQPRVKRLNREYSGTLLKTGTGTGITTEMRAIMVYE